MGSVIFCGTDIVEIERVRGLVDRYGDRFLRRVYGSLERAEAEKRRDPGPFLAGRFAAKEAALKVLGCGLFAGIRLTEIEVPARESGEPYCVLRGEALRRAQERGIEQIVVSVSHCDAYAVANAVGVG
jgi:holo-[acyl-carrier protein] synthase